MITRIADIAYYLPENTLTNEQLHAAYPSWNVHQVAERVGVLSRHIALPEETAFQLAVKACHALFAKHPALKASVDGIIFCTQTPDYIMPSNSSLLHDALELGENLLAFDINIACSGFPYALGIARGLLMSKAVENILIINADTYSKHINEGDRSTRMLFGDGAAVSWITQKGSQTSGEVVDIRFATSGKLHQKFIIPAGGCRLPKTQETSMPRQDESGNFRALDNIYMEGLSILSFVKTKVVDQIRSLCQAQHITIDQIDLFVFHQASKLALDTLQKLLGIEAERMFTNLENIGNTVSASIPIALKDALDSHRIQSGKRVLISGFGVGLSWSSALLQY